MSSYRNLLLMILSLSYVSLFTACDPTPEDIFWQGRDYESSAIYGIDDGKRPEKFRKAYECYQQASQQGYSKANYYLGCCYYYGSGVSKDYEQAVNYFQDTVEDWTLSDEDKVDAQLMLGDCYSYGRGVSQDFVEAAKWYRLAAEQGKCKAQFFLGNCYFYGRGVVEDKEKAVFWYRKAAENENGLFFSKYACSKLGECYAFGYGVPKDIQKAIELWQKAVDVDSDAQYYLGLCYAEGLGVPKDVDKAVELLHEAAKDGHEKAAQALDDLLNQRN